MRNRSAFGTIFIVDISGFSSFVQNISTEEGAMIMPALFDSILRANYYSLHVAEIEGDAILFYKMGDAFSIKTIFEQFNKMVLSFHSEIDLLKKDFPEISALTIKVVVHYGEMSGFKVGGYYKLYGKPLIEAHRLLKNHINSKTYLLITKSYYDQNQETIINKGTNRSEVYDIGNIYYTYFAFSSIVYPNMWLA
ncbi:DUF2652 domain-containing protein [Flavobacterium sp. ARAG 55.4]|uniref:DUF2652 domain-containing protein n=1 Tax=Flavobacterium sp. ARAG 55.4 TaxID=3451357 RepID=UPI003F47E935